MQKLSLGECFKDSYEYLIKEDNNFVYLKKKKILHLFILHPLEQNVPTSHMYIASLKYDATLKETSALCHVLNPDRN